MINTIQCPKGTYAVRGDKNVISIILINSLSRETSKCLIDSINLILETDRDREWVYCIYALPQVVLTFDAESKLREFMQFRLWLSRVKEKGCKLAVVFAHAIQQDKNYIVKVLEEEGLCFELFPDLEEAYGWLTEELP